MLFELLIDNIWDPKKTNSTNIFTVNYSEYLYLSRVYTKIIF